MAGERSTHRVWRASSLLERQKALGDEPHDEEGTEVARQGGPEVEPRRQSEECESKARHEAEDEEL